VKKYSTVAVGDITGSDELWHNYAIEIHRALATELTESKSFSQVQDPAPRPPSIDALVISGHITDVDKGSAAARWIVGFGAGRAHMTAEFELKDGGGNRISLEGCVMRGRAWRLGRRDIVRPRRRRAPWCGPSASPLERMSRLGALCYA
jgi:hypothetical protein